MKKNLKSVVTRSLVYFLAGCLVAEPAFAGTVTISPTPLATAGGGASVLPNLLFTLDGSGSMAWDYLPDYLNNEDNGNNQCMTRSGGGNDCQAGDPIWYTGGSSGTNGVAYDPRVFYKPALNPNGTTVSTAPLNTGSVPVDAFGAQSNSTIDITSAIQDNKFCNSSSGSAVCKRNGTTGNNTTLTAANSTDGQGNTMPNAGEFPYRTHLTNSSTAIFGLPEMMAIGQFVKSSGTVTATTLAPHLLTTSDRVFVNTGSTNFDQTCAAVTAVTANTFTYTSGTGSVTVRTGSFRKCYVSQRFVRNKSGSGNFVGSPTSLVQVTTTAHGLQTGDLITTIGASDSTMNISGVAVTVVDANNFTFNTSATSTQDITGHWVRTGLYNVRGTVNGPAIAYMITPVEYCSDPSLTNCVQVLPGNTPPTGFTFPAYVRFCQTAEQALAPDAIGDASGTPRCRSKYIGYGASPSWKFGRYGWFTREDIVNGVTFRNRPNRADCTTSGTTPDCTYTEESQNYARWYAYYHTRMQMMKTTAGRAFFPLISTGSANDKLRVGFITINPTFNNASGSSDQGTVQSSKYLKIDTFRTAQATSWYSKFYAQIPDQSTPLREALSRAGWIYAGKLNVSGGLTDGIPTADDPVIASCQRHFTLLTTDGYWNGNGPQDLQGNPIGTTDSVNPQTDSPYTTVAVDRTSTGTFDGAAASSTTTSTPTTQDKQVVCEGNLQTNFGGGGDTACGCGITQHRVIDRTTVTTQNVTVGGASPGTTTTSSTTFAPAAPPDGTCSQGTYTTSIQHQNVKQAILCDNRSNPTITFPNGATKTCGFCDNTKSGKRYVLIRQTAQQDKTTTTVDGFQTDVSTGFVNVSSSTYEYSSDGSTFTTTVPTSNAGCNSNNGSLNASGPTTTNNGSPVAGASGTGTSLALISPNPSTPVVGTPTVNVTVTGGYDDTLADVAMYYYRSDLRGGKDTKGNTTGPALNAAGVDVSPNNVPVADGSKNYAAHQAMVTFTVGLADGNLRYQPDYDTSSTGDFANIKAGATNACFWSTGTCNWPEPIHDTPAALDDLWHAAVNGRGQFYLATNVDALATGIQNTLTALGSQFAAAAASATSSPNVTQTDNQIFSTTYETNTWAGKVFAQLIDPATGNVNPAIQWQADALLLGKVTATTDTRTLLTFAPAGTNKVKSFTFANLDSTEQAFFTNKCSSNTTWTPLLTQCTALSGGQQTTINAGSTMVDFLRGQTGNEGTLYRDRTLVDPSTGVITQTIMGDTISAKPNYIRAPTFDYGGSYNSFITAQASRAPRVYVGANDGFMHAFDGNSGAEAWAYLPRFLMPKLPILADKTYATTHTYFVEGSPEINDVFDSTSGTWKTILVGGAAGGGRGYYALDITDPNSPIALWEWCADSNQCDPTTADPDIGLTYGNPVFGKRAYDGRWVVVFTSGLNNLNAGSTSGGGFFWVVDAITGQKLDKVGTNISGTNVGTNANPSGLMKMAPFYTGGGKVDATFQYIYAGDQLGNVWRLDVNASPLPATVLNPAPAPIVTRITVLKDGAGRLQPITTRPIPSVVVLSGSVNQRVLYFGTGRYLGTPDLTDGGGGTPAWQQSFYAFKDIDYTSASATTNLRADANLVQRSFTQISPTERGISTTPTVTMDWNTKDGWFIDFNPGFGSPAVADSPGEGVNLVDPRLVNGTIFVTTNVPANSAGGAVCATGGSSFQYQFDFKSGLPVATSPNGAVGWANQNTITVGVAIVQLPNGAIKAITTGADTSKTTSNVNTNLAGTVVKRFSYRLR